MHNREKFVDGKFVDLLIRDNYVVLCGHKLKRENWISPSVWREDWIEMRRRLAARGPMKAINMYDSDLDAFQRMIAEG